MTPHAAGQIRCGDEGRVHIRIREDQYYVFPEDLGMLFFVGDCVPILKKGPAPQVHEVSGTVYLYPSGRAVIVAINMKRYLVPRDKFLAVAFGEEVTCNFLEVPTDATEIKIISPQKEGETS